MEWYRAYHGLCADPKLVLVAKDAGVRRSVVIAAWHAVLEIASSASERGSLADLSVEAVSMMIGEPKKQCERVLLAFAGRGMIGENSEKFVKNWKKRQFSSDDATQRTRKYRSSKSLETNKTEQIGNVSVTFQERHRDGPETETETETDLRSPITLPLGVKDSEISCCTQIRSTIVDRVQGEIIQPNSFDEFWSAVPRKVGKAAAAGKYTRLIKSKKAKPDELISGMLRYAEHVHNAGTEQQYIVHPLTWLNQGRWQDELHDEESGNPALELYKRINGVMVTGISDTDTAEQCEDTTSCSGSVLDLGGRSGRVLELSQRRHA